RQILLRVVVRGVEIALRYFDLCGGSLCQQDFLDDEVVEDVQLGGQRLLVRQGLRLVACTPEDLVDVCAGDGLAIDDCPCVRRDSRGSGRSRRRSARSAGESGQEAEKSQGKVIAGAGKKSQMKHSLRAYFWIARQNKAKGKMENVLR